VINGQDEKLPDGKHTYLNVYKLMFLQICRDYHSLPDPKQLKRNEIKFFYEGLRADLKMISRG
jgi:hypothetical protein